MSVDKIPDVVLVKKVYAEKSLRVRRRYIYKYMRKFLSPAIYVWSYFFIYRKWKLKRIDEIHQETGSVTSDNDEYGDFLNDLEEDTELRQHINVYKDTRKTAVDQEEADDEIPQITLAEMLDDLVLEKNESSME